MKKRHLYYETIMSEGIHRVEIVEETESHMFVRHYPDCEALTTIPKKTYTVIGPFAYQTIIYKEETPKLLEEYKLMILKKKFLRKLKDLQECKNKDIIKKVIDIKYEIK